VEPLSVERFVKELEGLKDILQESLQLFRQAKTNIVGIEVAANEFLLRRHIQIETGYLRKFEENINHMNDTVGRFHKSMILKLATAESRAAFLKVRRSLKALQNAFDLESPAIMAALHEVETRLKKEKSSL